MLDHPEIGAICAGGRYDNLAEYYSDRSLPGVGVAIGLTRLFYVLDEQGMLNPDLLTAPADVLLLPMTDDFTAAVELATRFRNAGLRTQIYSCLLYTSAERCEQDLESEYAPLAQLVEQLTLNPVSYTHLAMPQATTAGIPPRRPMATAHRLRLLRAAPTGTPHPLPPRRLPTSR